MTDARLDYVANSTTAISEHARMIAELGRKRQRALASLVADGWTISDIGKATSINRQSLYKAARRKAS